MGLELSALSSFSRVVVELMKTTQGCVEKFKDGRHIYSGPEFGDHTSEVQPLL